MRWVIGYIGIQKKRGVGFVQEAGWEMVGRKRKERAGHLVELVQVDS